MTAAPSPERRPCWGRAAGIYLCLALLGGITLLVVTPPMQVADEWAHLDRAWSLANGTWVGEGMGGFVPEPLHGLFEDTAARFGEPLNRPVPLADWLKLLGDLAELHITGSPARFVGFPTVLYSPVPYAGMGAGVAIAQEFSDRPLVLLYAGRLGGLLAAVLLSVWAISVAPFGKWFFALLALTPVAMLQSSGMNADSLTLALALLLAAGVTRAGYGTGNVGTGQVLLLALNATALALCKQAYLPLSLAVWLIPGTRFRSAGHRRAAWWGIPLLAATATAAWTLLVLRHHYHPPRPGTDAFAQLAWIAGQPLDYLATLGRELGRNGENYVRQMIATVGYPGIPGSSLLVAAQLAALWLAARHGGSGPESFGAGRRLWALVLTIGGAVWIMTLLYLWWTPVGDRVVEGVQGRYFLPLLSLLPLALAGRASQRQQRRGERIAVVALWFWGGFLVANTINRVISHYYAF